MNEPGPETFAGDATTFGRLAMVATIELDRFCDGCGYNLRTQAVRRDPRTQILMCRCPECGRFHPAADHTTVARPWLRRLGAMALAVWIFAIGGGVIGLAIGQGGLTVLALDELGRPRYIISRDLAKRTRMPSLHTMPGSYEYKFALGVCSAGSLALSFVGIGLLTVFCHHWPRSVYVVVAALLPVSVMAVVWVAVWIDKNEPIGWMTQYFFYMTIVQIGGGLLGVIGGRPLARLLAVVFLPPRSRQVLAFLWLIDGKTPPGVATDPRASAAKPVSASDEASAPPG